MPADAAPSYLWLETLPAPGARVVLANDEAHYLARVCRARIGDLAHATDGRGGLARVRVTALQPELEVEGEALERAPASRTAIVLAGAPEGERGDWLVEKLAELGIAILQPVDCERSRWRSETKRLERWRRLATAALRQSRRRFRLEVRPPVPLATAAAGLESGARFLCEPGGRAAGGWAPPPSGASIGLVGPSEGLSIVEQDLARTLGFEPIRLSDARLRTETAAVAWAAWWAGGGPA